MTLHECRHTFASLLIDAGVNAKAIQEFMGHGTIEETFSRYGHLMPGARDHARELVDKYLGTAMQVAAIPSRTDPNDWFNLALPSRAGAGVLQEDGVVLPGFRPTWAAGCNIVLQHAT